MTTMDNISEKVQTLVKALCGMFEWKCLTSAQKLIGLIVFSVIVTLFVGGWSLLIVSIVTLTLVTYFTDRVLTVSSDPLARVVGGLERCQETLSGAYCRLVHGSRQPEKLDLRTRSESIASLHIPDLEIDIESGGSGGTYQKKIRLELNSIILLIIRDFVQFWYNTFSYNSQFLKDARQFLFKGFHNIVDRLSRLGPHKTTAKLIHAYRKHLASFQMAKTMFEQQDKGKQCSQDIQPKSRSKLKRLESIDEAFPINYHFHPALKSKEAERQYLRSLTKVILLCSCSRDVVSAQSAQLFFVEVLSQNVLLPVMEMLSTPDRLYELLIKLTYSDDGIMTENTIKELVDMEVKRRQLQCGETQTELMSAVAQAASDSQDDSTGSTTGSTSSQNFGQCAKDGVDDNSTYASTARQTDTHGKQNDSQVVGTKSKHCDNSLVVMNNSDQSKEPIPNNEGHCVRDTDCDKDAGGTVSQKCAIVPETENKWSNVNNATTSENAEAEAKQTAKTPASEADGLESSAVAQETSNSDETEKSSVCNKADTDTASLQTNHIYGEIVSTSVPVLKPKLQAFKDLFRSKRSKQIDENKTEQTSDGQKNQPEEAMKSSSDSILPTQRLKSLRLSPLLNRASKLSPSDNVLSSSTSSKEATEKPSTDSKSDKQTPSPLPTPSPSQPAKGGPLSFFRFRKPNLDFRRTPTSADDKSGDAASSGAPSSMREDSAPSDQSAASTKVPSVQISDESVDTSGTNRSSKPTSSSPSPKPSPSPSPSSSSAELHHSAQTISVSSYDEMSNDLDLKTPKQDPKRPVLFIGSGEEVEEGEEAEILGVGREEEEASETIVPDSSLIFQDISIPSTMTCQEYRSNAQFTVYQIEYEALHFSESGIPVMKTGTAKRRYREFINLMSRLEDNSAYKGLLKDVKGPKRWLTLPFKNMDKESVAGRQTSLEQFLKSLIEVEAVCNGPEMREFLAYEGDSHIAFVKKTTEINVPRIDKMLARTVSGVFDKLKSLPNLPQEMISGIRGRDSVVERKDSVETDTDSICVLTEYSHDFTHDLSCNNALRDASESYVREIQTQGHPDPPPSSPTSQILKDMGPRMYHQILLEVPRVEGDGAEYPDTAGKEGQTGVGVMGSEHLVLCDAVLDLLVQLIQGQGHWLCHQRLLTAFRNMLGTTMDRWVRESVTNLTTEERCLYYIRLLRETVWPNGKLFDSSSEEKTSEEREATRAVAKRLLLHFFPGAVLAVLGTDSMENGVDVILDSLQYSQLNKHFLYSTIDMLLESLFSEIADDQFQGRLLP